MKRQLPYVFCILLVACRPHKHETEGTHRPTDERPALSFTHWTDDSELFIELPALVKGQESPCAAHVTKLTPFSALASGSVAVVLRGKSGDERFVSDKPTQPGIFRPVARPAGVGPHRLIVEIRSEGLQVEHDLGEVMVYESTALAQKGIPEEPEASGRIPFLKEQQWPIEFATAVVSERAMRSGFRTWGTLRPRNDGDVVVAAPSAGRVASSGRAFPQMGTKVAVGDVLGLLAPRLEAADLASLELAVTSANLELRFAESEKQRLEGLSGEGAVPQRRVQDALRVAESAKATLSAAQQRLSQFRRVENTTGRGQGTVALKAPLSGVVTEVLVAPGAFVEAGAPLFRVTDLTQLWLETRVPEVDVHKLTDTLAASFSVEGSKDSFDLPKESLVARGHVLSDKTQTLPILFSVDNAGARFSPGSAARVFLATGEERSVMAVPETAIVDDGGMSVVFVQVEGESFERRIVRLGAIDRGYIEIKSGVTVGEHIATTGAWSLKLAASSGSVPAHGHAH